MKKNIAYRIFLIVFIIGSGFMYTYNDYRLAIHDNNIQSVNYELEKLSGFQENQKLDNGYDTIKGGLFEIDDNVYQLAFYNKIYIVMVTAFLFTSLLLTFKKKKGWLTSFSKVKRMVELPWDYRFRIRRIS